MSGDPMYDTGMQLEEDLAKQRSASRVSAPSESSALAQDAAEDWLLVGDFVATAGASQYSLILARIDEINGEGPMAVLKMTTKANRKVARLAAQCVKTMRQEWKAEQ